MCARLWYVDRADGSRQPSKHHRLHTSPTDIELNVQAFLNRSVDLMTIRTASVSILHARLCTAPGIRASRPQCPGCWRSWVKTAQDILDWLTVFGGLRRQQLPDDMRIFAVTPELSPPGLLSLARNLHHRDRCKNRQGPANPLRSCGQRARASSAALISRYVIFSALSKFFPAPVVELGLCHDMHAWRKMPFQ